MTKQEEQIIPFETDQNGQKFYSSSFGDLSLFGIPNSYGGVNRRNQLSWNKKGVALAYMLIPTLKAAVDVIAGNLASTPMILSDETGYSVARSTKAGSSSFLDGIESSYRYYHEPLIKLWATSYLLYGEVVIEKAYDTNSTYNGLKWLNPLATDIYVEQKQTRSIIDNAALYRDALKFRYTGRFDSVVYDEEEVLYTRSFNPIDDYKGYSDSLAALSKANITIEFDNFTLAFYANNGHPAVIISPKDKMVGERQIAEWRRQWQENYRGANNQFKTHISGFPFDVSTFDLLDVSKPLEVSKEADRQILKSLRVPPEMIGDTANNSYQFSKESKNAFMQTVVKPVGLAITNCINHSGIVQEFGDDDNLKFGFDFSEFENVAKSDLDQQELLERRFKSGAISLGAYQKATNEEVVEGADNFFLVPDGFVPVSKDLLSKPNEIQTKPKEGANMKLPSEQTERPTESSTEDEESLEFFGSKSSKKGSVFDVNPDWAMDVGKHVPTELVDANLGDPDWFRKTFFKSVPKKYDHINFNPPEGVQSAAKRALEWIEQDKAGDGFTDVGRARASDLASGDYQPSPEVVRRMASYFSRHEPDKKAEGFSSGEDGYPSAGRVAWDAWGGDAGASWSSKVVEQMDSADKKETKKSISILDIQEIASQKDLSLSEALSLFEEFEQELEDDY